MYEGQRTKDKVRRTKDKGRRTKDEDMLARKMNGILHLVHRPFDFVLP